MKEHFLLSEVAKVLSRRPHQIVYPMVTGKIPEPQSRIANKRLFAVGDIERLAKHFRVSPNWAALEPSPAGADAETPERLTLRPPFEVISIGETGNEVRDGDGQIFAWTPDRGRGLVLAGLLETAARG